MSHTAQRFLTGLHAALASLGADPAMFVFAGVTPALIAAKTARNGANVEHAADHLLIRPGSAGRETARYGANVGAIKVEADALREFPHTFLSQARVGARRACLCTRVAFLNTADQSIVGLSSHIGMGADHLMSLHDRLRFSSRRPCGSRAWARLGFIPLLP
jgi:hypothetical protein